MHEIAGTVRSFVTKPLKEKRSDFMLWLYENTKTKTLRALSQKTQAGESWLTHLEKDGSGVSTVRKHVEFAKNAGVSLDEYFTRLLAANED